MLLAIFPMPHALNDVLVIGNKEYNQVIQVYMSQLPSLTPTGIYLYRPIYSVI